MSKALYFKINGKVYSEEDTINLAKSYSKDNKHLITDIHTALDYIYIIGIDYTQVKGE